MFKNAYKTITIVFAVIAILSIGAFAFADRDGGYGHRGSGPHHGYGMNDGYHGYGHHGYGRGYGPGSDYGDDLTREEIETLEKQAEVFEKDTAKLRENVYQKQLALRSELARENPDAKKAAELQKEISDLRAEFDQKRVEYQIKTRKTAPNAGRGMMRGYGSRGYGARGSGDCWR